MYIVYRKENGKLIKLCSQSNEDKDTFKQIVKNPDHEIYLDDKKITNKYKSRSKNI